MRNSKPGFYLGYYYRVLLLTTTVIILGTPQYLWSQDWPEITLEKRFKPRVYQDGQLIKDIQELDLLYQQTNNQQASQYFLKYEKFKKASLPMALGGALIIGIETGDLIAGNRLDPTWVTIGVVLGLGALISKNASNSYLYQSIESYQRQQKLAPQTGLIPQRGLGLSWPLFKSR